MRQNKLACNSTNSAAIDCENEIFVWGSSQHGLLGNGLSSGNSYKTPTLLQITRNNFQNEVFSRGNQTQFKVEDVSMGHMHMAAVVSDADTQQEFRELDYAIRLLQSLKDCLLKHFKDLIKLGKVPLRNQQALEPEQIEFAIQDLFQKDKDIWPFASVKTFNKILFRDAQIPFTQPNQIAIDQIVKDLSQNSQGGKNQINLKELRDQLIGWRKNKGLVFTWGAKDERTGLENETNADVDNFEFTPPREISFEVGIQIVKVECGQAHTLALTSQGEVYSWGSSSQGCLGLGPNVFMSHLPRAVQFQMDQSDRNEMLVSANKFVRIEQISTGSNHCLALSTHKKVYSWGSGQGGKLGHGDQIGKSQPTIVHQLLDKQVVKVECGDAHSGCLTAQGILYMWGVGLNGRLGFGETTDTLLPKEMIGSNDMQLQRIYFGMSSSFGTMRSGACAAWGSGQYGKLGIDLSSAYQYLQPRTIERLKDFKIEEFATGPFHTLALSSEGAVFAFGNSKYFKLGFMNLHETDNDSSSQPSSFDLEIPRQISNKVFFKEKGIKKFQNIYNQFTEFTDSWTIKDTNYGQDTNISQVVCTLENSYLLRNDGLLYINGSNRYFQCTNDEVMLDQQSNAANSELLQLIQDKFEDGKSKKYFYIPDEARKHLINQSKIIEIVEPTLLNVKQISELGLPVSLIVKHITASKNHVLVTTDDGRCFGWGDNKFGQLGIGSNADVIKMPTVNSELQSQKIVMCAAGRNHSLFLSSLGQVYSAGFDEFGQLGLDSDQQNYSQFSRYVDQLEGRGKGPHLDQETVAYNFRIFKTKIGAQLIKRLQGICFIASGDYHSLAISSLAETNTQKQAIYTWGQNTYGQLGHANLDTSQPSLVVFPQKELQIVQVSAGPKHTLALDSNNKVWYFGQKESVGIQCVDQFCQFQPKRLRFQTNEQTNKEFTDAKEKSFIYRPQDKSFMSRKRDIHGQSYDSKQIKNSQPLEKDKDFVFLAAGASKNFAIELQDKTLYQFGGLDENEKNQIKSIQNSIDYHQTLIKKVKDSNGEQIHANFVSAGVNHFCAIASENQQVYVWGKSKLCCVDTSKIGGGSDVVENPVAMPFFERIREKNIKQAQINHNASMVMSRSRVESKSRSIIKDEQKSIVADDPQDIEPPPTKRYAFIQKISENLKLVDVNFGAEVAAQLVNQDNSLVTKFNNEVTDFSDACKGLEQKWRNLIINAQDAIITRVLNFPTKIDLLANTLETLPENILRDKLHYEKIFTLLQIHPCYLLKMLTNSSHVSDPEQQIALVKIVFGQRTIFEKSRVLNILVVLAQKILEYEVQRYSLVKIVQVGVKARQVNKTSVFAQIFRLIVKSQACNLKLFQNSQNDLLSCMMTEVLNTNYNTKSDSTSQQTLICNTIVQALPLIRKRFKLLTQQDSADAKNNLSTHVVSVFNHARKYLIDQKPESYQQVDRFLLSLIFQDFVIRQRSILKSDFEIESTILLQKSPAFLEIIGFESQNNLWYKLIDCLWAYITETQNIQYNKQLNHLLRTGKPQNTEKIKNYKIPRQEIILSLLGCVYPPIQSDWVLVKQMFLSSLETEDANLSVALSDLQYVVNILQTDDQLFIHNRDPIKILVEKLQVVPKTQYNSKQLNLRINLRIRHRQLLDSSNLVKCGDCYAPLNEAFIGSQRFDEALNGISWKCESVDCTQTKVQTGYACQGCGQTTSILPKDSVFPRFTQMELSPFPNQFAEVLRMLQIVQPTQDFNDILQQEIKRQTASIVATKQLNDFKSNLEIMTGTQFNKMDVDQSELNTEEQAHISLIIQSNILKEAADEINAQITQQFLHKQILTVSERQIDALSPLKNELKYIDNLHSNLLQKIYINAYTGQSSEFLKDKLENISLNFESERQDQQNGSLVKPQAANQSAEFILSGRFQMKDKIQSHKNQIPATNIPNQGEENCLEKKSQISAFTYKQMLSKKIIISDSNIGHEETRLHQQSLDDREYKLQWSTKESQERGLDPQLLKNSTFFFAYVFKDNPSFEVELILKKSQKVSVLTCTEMESEQLLDQFKISQDQLIEIRRNLSKQCVVTLGKLQFNLAKLGPFLNRIISQNDVFAEARQLLSGEQLSIVNEDERRNKVEQGLSEWEQQSVVNLTSLNKDQKLKRQQKSSKQEKGVTKSKYKKEGKDL